MPQHGNIVTKSLEASNRAQAESWKEPPLWATKEQEKQMGLTWTRNVRKGGNGGGRLGLDHVRL